MIQCQDCEYFNRGENGEISLSCDPFSTIKEPQCVQKWQLIKINQMVSCYQSTLNYYEKFAPMQEKMFNYMEKEIDDLSEADQWKSFDDEDDDDDNEGLGFEFDNDDDFDNDEDDWHKPL